MVISLKYLKPSSSVISIVHSLLTSLTKLVEFKARSRWLSITAARYSLGSGAEVDRGEGIYGDGSLVGFAERSRGSTAVIARGVVRRACCEGTESKRGGLDGKVVWSSGERGGISGVLSADKTWGVYPRYTSRWKCGLSTSSPKMFRISASKVIRSVERVCSGVGGWTGLGGVGGWGWLNFWGPCGTVPKTEWHRQPSG